MTASELINPMIPPLKPTDLLQKALDWMDEFKVSMLPVVDKGSFLGLISEEKILESSNAMATVNSIELLKTEIKVNEHQHFYDVMRQAIETGTQVVPVFSDNNEFLGVISINTTLLAFSQMSFINSPGAIIVLLINERDYSLAEISRLIEENSCKILSVFVANDLAEPTKVRVTIKLNKTEITRVIATLERFSYEIIAQFSDKDNVFNDSDQDRLGMLFKFLNM
jgi:acetoin utilization protein AcuB